MRALFYTVLARFRGFARPAGGDDEFDEEVSAHLAMIPAKNLKPAPVFGSSMKILLDKSKISAIAMPRAFATQ